MPSYSAALARIRPPRLVPKVSDVRVHLELAPSILLPSPHTEPLLLLRVNHYLLLNPLWSCPRLRAVLR